MTTNEKNELSELLLKQASDGTEGILERDRKTFTGDKHAAVNSRVRELLALL